MESENQSSPSTDVAQPVDLDPEVALERLDAWIDGAVRLLPNIIVGLIILAIAVGVAALVRRLIIQRATKRGRKNLGEVLGGFIKWTIILLGGLLAATIIVPTLRPGDLIAGLGVSSVAIGFAFKDILQNWLAGVLILLRQPFSVDDQIRVSEYEGTVERIESRSTIIKTYDGQRVVIPNSQIYTNSILVKTAHELRRSEYDVGIGYGDDIDQACDVIVAALKGIDGVKADPAPEALP
jgi:small-conductance mechanosensitive channel